MLAVHEAVAGVLGRAEADRQEILPRGAQALYRNRSGSIHGGLKQAGRSSSPRRGLWQLALAAMSFADTHPVPLPADAIEEIATGHMDVRLRPVKGSPEESSTVARMAFNKDARVEGDKLGRYGRVVATV